MNRLLSSFIVVVSVFAASQLLATDLDEPNQISAVETGDGVEQIRQGLVDHCMGRPDCRASLLSDHSWLNGNIPDYDEETAASGWPDIRGTSQPEN